jgi:hypothetical protein
MMAIRATSVRIGWNFRTTKLLFVRLSGRSRIADRPHRVMRLAVAVLGGEVIYQASLEFNGEASSDMRAKANGAGPARGNGKMN